MPPRASTHHLSITPKPYKPSNLSIPVSPFSPRLPITPPVPPPKPTTAPLATTSTILPSHTRHHNQPLTPPTQPLHWLWQCHICHRCYRLGVTRRCLDDGHAFCSGSTVVKRSKTQRGKKVLRHKACQSEFDYQGWKVWGTWRRGGRQRAALGETDGAKKKDCWDSCDYPSECRWGRQFGVATPSPARAQLVLPSSSPAVLGDDEDVAMRDFEAGFALPVLEEEEEEEPAAGSWEETKLPSVEEVVESVQRRKRRSAGLTAPSPLASHPLSNTEEGGVVVVVDDEEDCAAAQALRRALDAFELDLGKKF
ncbi:hypothetical protein BDY17DRAFT_319713 [Neohortaea acidophila]|uniref:Uncharacterized protein n=1 Tax=Neohortaea acidophila TaxID=245834 RepID=A0A6A6Q505_9PEZI|nr:uncharacterized protein BDY17DRAFT_319713 [Neohortaea acidophila]KAF2487151.1 hypothetical protein BDY17DRAFT_319713 [Neohortaea acidophila]